MFSKQSLIYSVLKYVKCLLIDFLFLFRNTTYCFKLKQISSKVISENYVITSAAYHDLKDIFPVYCLLNKRDSVGCVKYILYSFFSKKLLFVVKDIVTSTIVGIEMYYFNKRDVKEQTIHQAFRGIIPQYQGKGIGTKLTAYAIEHFKKNKLKGISSRVSLNNTASYYSNSKLGFRPVENYFDKEMNEERAYMVCPFDSHKEPC